MTEDTGNPQVRGHSRFDRPAPIFARVCAGLVDGLAGWLLCLILYWIFTWDPLIDRRFGITLILGILIPVIVAKKFSGQSFGELVFGIRARKTRALGSWEARKGGILTLVLAGACCGVFSFTVLGHPFWQLSEPEILLPAVVPPSDWKVLAFYYTMAPWPTAVGGTPVFYSVPYELGPPQRFVGDISADWITESVRLTIEGPRTPLDFQSRALSRVRLKECFSSSPLLNPSCVEIRRITLARSLERLHDEGYAKFQIAWFLADNPGIPDEERAQGVRLRAIAGARTQDRYILVTPNGIHEAIELSYLDNQEGRLAEKDLRVALGALRISEDLAPGRAWTDSLLGSVRLDHLPPETDEAYVFALSDIESSLVSMISVNPASFAAYYHLAGSSFMLLKYATKYPEAKASRLRSLAQDMVARMARYGHDVAPASPQLSALDRMAQEAKQF